MKLENVLVLIADGVPDFHGEACNIEDVELPHESVPVTLDFDPTKPLGRATNIHRDGNRVYADLELIVDAEGCAVDPDEPTSKGVNGLVPGRYIYIKKDGNRTLFGCEVTGIGLCTTGNTDKRISVIGESQYDAFRRQMGLDKERYIFVSDKPMAKLLSNFWFPQCGPRPQGMTPQEFLKACGLEIYYDPSMPSDEIQFGYTEPMYGCDCKVVTRKMKIGEMALTSGSPRLTA